MTLGLILGLLLLGLVVGGLARLAVPGPDPMPLYWTIALGLAGSVLGGALGEVLFGRPGGVGLGLVCAMLLLIAYRRFVQKRPIWGPGGHLPPRS